MLRSVIWICIAAHAWAQNPSSDPGSGFADELDEKYGVVSTDVPSRDVMRQLINFDEDSKFRMPSLALNLGKRDFVMDLSSDPMEAVPGNTAPDRELGDSQADAKDVSSNNEHDRHSQGTFLRATGSFFIADVLADIEPNPDVLEPVQRRATNAAAQLPTLIELGESGYGKDQPGELAIAEANAIAEQDDNGEQEENDLGAVGDGENAQPRRPGWQQRLTHIPGLEQKRAMAKMLARKNNNLDNPDHHLEKYTAHSFASTAKASAKASRAPNDPLTSSDQQLQYIGCYADNSASKVLPVSAGDGDQEGDESKPNSMHPMKCARLCKGYDLIGLQTIGIRSYCYCGKSTGKARVAKREKCKLPCAGAPELKCGAEMYMSIFHRELKKAKLTCWTGKELVSGLDRSRPWERYQGCSICDGADRPMVLTENWQLWGKKMDFNDFANCLSCHPLDALVVTDPKRGTGFCRQYYPEIDKDVRHVYPYYAHWDGLSHFTHTKIIQKIASPHMRSGGNAYALCRMWKQVTCFPDAKALRQIWDQYRTKSRTMGSKELPKLRFLQCDTKKTVRCNKVCVATKSVEGAFDCASGKHVHASKSRGLKDVLGKGLPGQGGRDYCCFDDCQIPKTHSKYKEDGSFWCKDEAMLL